MWQTNKTNCFLRLALALACLVMISVPTTSATILNSSNIGTRTSTSTSGEDTDDYNHAAIFSDEFTSAEYADEEMLDTEQGLEQSDHNWDVLIFTQQWPVTTCYHWREQDKQHACKLPTAKEFWTIHGIWPTKLGNIGPNFCNSSAAFDINQLADIAQRLQQYWPDIDGKTQYNWLWKHEWLKHGTCAAELERLDNENKYFEQGLEWRERFLISNILDDANIHPDSNNTVVALQNALYKALGKNPSIHCLYDDKRDLSLLSEIRICFDKTLQLIDCDGIKRGDAKSFEYPGGRVLTNCHVSKPVHYPSTVPATLRGQKQQSWQFPVVNMYKLIQFIMWFTL